MGAVGPQAPSLGGEKEGKGEGGGGGEERSREKVIFAGQPRLHLAMLSTEGRHRYSSEDVQSEKR